MTIISIEMTIPLLDTFCETNPLQSLQVQVQNLHLLERDFRRRLARPFNNLSNNSEL